MIIVLFLLLVFAVPVSAETITQQKYSLGGMVTSGNSQVESLSVGFLFNRNEKWINELTFQGSLDYQATGGAQTLYKLFSSLRYAYSRGKQLYNFFKLEAEHDRFQNIDLRLIPSVGLGYWFADQKDSKAMVEAALGYQRKYMVNQTNDELIVAKFRSYWLRGDFSNNLNVYVAANDLNNYRFVNEANYQVKLNSNYAFKLKLKDQYNNQPATGVQNNDLLFTVGLEYSHKTAN